MLALKGKLQDWANSMKVEGDWRMKLAVYGGAILVVTFILMVMLLIFGQFNTGTPQVGTVTISSGGQEYTPLANQIYTTHKRERTESRRLVPSEVGDSAPTVPFDHSTTVQFDGWSDNGDFAFTIYDQDGLVYTETASSFQCPEEPGTYLVCEECYWGTQRENIGMEYYFWIEVSQEYLDHEEEE